MPRVTFCGTWNLPSLSRKFGSRYAGKPIKGFKDFDDSLESKKTSAQKWLIGLVPRAKQNWPKRQKHVPIMTSPIETPNPKRKKICNLNEKTSRICWRFEQFFSSIGWWVMVLQSSAKMWIKGKPPGIDSVKEGDRHGSWPKKLMRFFSICFTSLFCKMKVFPTQK